MHETSLYPQAVFHSATVGLFCRATVDPGTLFEVYLSKIWKIELENSRADKVLPVLQKATKATKADEETS